MSTALKEDAEAMECFQRNISNKDGHPLKKKQGCQGAKSLTKGSAFDEIEKGHEVYWFQTKKPDGKIEYKYYTSCSNGVSTDTLCRSHKDQQKQGKNPFMLMEEIRVSDKHELLKLKGNEDFFKNQIEKKNRKNKKASNETSIEMNLNDNPLYIVLQNFDKLPSSIKNNLLITCNQIIQENNLFETKTDKNVKELTLDNSTNKQLLQTIQQKQIEYDKCNQKEDLFKLIHDDDMEDEIVDTTHHEDISITSEHIEEEDELLESDKPNSITNQKSSDILSDSDDSDDHEEEENEIDAIEIQTKKGKLLYLNSEDYVVYEPEDGEFSELGKLEVVDISYATIDYDHRNWTILRKIDNPVESDEKNKEIYLCSLTNNVFNLQKKYLGVLTQKKNNMYVIKKKKASK
jgi:hypothetical protein